MLSLHFSCEIDGLEMFDMHEATSLIRRQDSESLSSGLANGNLKSPRSAEKNDRNNNNNQEDKLNPNTQKKSSGAPTPLPKPAKTKPGSGGLAHAAVIPDVAESSAKTIDANQRQTGKGRHVHCDEAAARAGDGKSCRTAAHQRDESDRSGTPSDGECTYFPQAELQK